MPTACQIAIVRSVSVVKRSCPGTSVPESSSTRNDAAGEPVVIVLSSISSVKNATTGELVETPNAFGSGSTL